MADALAPAPGMGVALDSGYRHYAAICTAEGIEPYSRRPIWMRWWNFAALSASPPGQGRARAA
jgi:hypothetical protein